MRRGSDRVLSVLKKISLAVVRRMDWSGNIGSIEAIREVAVVDLVGKMEGKRRSMSVEDKRRKDSRYGNECDLEDCRIWGSHERKRSFGSGRK